MPRSCRPKRPNNHSPVIAPWHVACYFTGMNATPPVSQPQFGNDASQINATATNSAAVGAHSQDFAKALNDAGAKTSRKTTAHTSAGVDSSGGHLPVAGKSSPSPLPPPPPAAGAPAAGTVPAAPIARSNSRRSNSRRAAHLTSAVQRRIDIHYRAGRIGRRDCAAGCCRSTRRRGRGRFCGAQLRHHRITAAILTSAGANGPDAGSRRALGRRAGLEHFRRSHEHEFRAESLGRRPYDRRRRGECQRALERRQCCAGRANAIDEQRRGPRSRKTGGACIKHRERGIEGSARACRVLVYRPGHIAAGHGGRERRRRFDRYWRGCTSNGGRHCSWCNAGIRSAERRSAGHEFNIGSGRLGDTRCERKSTRHCAGKCSADLRGGGRNAIGAGGSGRRRCNQRPSAADTRRCGRGQILAQQRCRSVLVAEFERRGRRRGAVAEQSARS